MDHVLPTSPRGPTKESHAQATHWNMNMRLEVRKFGLHPHSPNESCCWHCTIQQTLLSGSGQKRTLHKYANTDVNAWPVHCKQSNVCAIKLDVSVHTLAVVDSLTNITYILRRILFKLLPRRDKTDSRKWLMLKLPIATKLRNELCFDTSWNAAWKCSWSSQKRSTESSELSNMLLPKTNQTECPQSVYMKFNLKISDRSFFIAC